MNGNTSTDVNIRDDDDIVLELVKIQDGAEQGTVPAKFRVQTTKGVIAPAGVAINLALTYTGSTAQVPNDVTSLPSPATIAAGQSSVTVTIPVVDNTIIDGTRFIQAKGGVITPVGGAFFRGSQLSSTASSVTLSITDNDRNDSNITVITISPGTVTETKSITLTASLPGNYTTAAPVTVTITPTPAFPGSGYWVTPFNGVPVLITSGSFSVVIGAGAHSASFTVATAPGPGSGVFSLSGTAASPYSVVSGTLTVTTLAFTLGVSNTVVPAAQIVGGSVTYTTVIRNTGLYAVGGVTSATLSITTTGVDVLTNGSGGISFTSGGASVTYVNGVGGIYVYTITNLPVGGSITLTYTGTISSTMPSAINTALIVPPVPRANNDPNQGYGTAQTFVKPVLAKPMDDITCSKEAMNKGFASIPTTFTTYAWTRTDTNKNVTTTTNTSLGTLLKDVLTNGTSVSQTVVYAVTPQITATVASISGTSTDVVTTTVGGAQSFTVVVKSKDITAQEGGTISINASNDRGTLVLTLSAPTGPAGVSNPFFHWYSDTGVPLVSQINGIQISDSKNGRGSVLRVPIRPPLFVLGNYKYYATVSGDASCESKLRDIKGYIPPLPQPITLTFVNASGGAITSILGGQTASIRASLPVGITVTTVDNQGNGLSDTIEFVQNTNSTVTVNDYEPLAGYSSVTIAYGSNSSTTEAFFAKNRRVIGLSSTLMLDVTGNPLYDYVEPGSVSPSIKIIDTTGEDDKNRIVTINPGTVMETQSITLTASLPPGIRIVSPLTVTITPVRPFPIST